MSFFADKAVNGNNTQKQNTNKLYYVQTLLPRYYKTNLLINSHILFVFV